MASLWTALVYGQKEAARRQRRKERQEDAADWEKQAQQRRAREEAEKAEKAKQRKERRDFWAKEHEQYKREKAEKKAEKAKARKIRNVQYAREEAGRKLSGVNERNASMKKKLLREQKHLENNFINSRNDYVKTVYKRTGNADVSKSDLEDAGYGEDQLREMRESFDREIEEFDKLAKAQEETVEKYVNAINQGGESGSANINQLIVRLKSFDNVSESNMEKYASVVKKNYDTTDNFLLQKRRAIDSYVDATKGGYDSAGRRTRGTFSTSGLNEQLENQNLAADGMDSLLENQSEQFQRGIASLDTPEGIPINVFAPSQRATASGGGGLGELDSPDIATREDEEKATQVTDSPRDPTKFQPGDTEDTIRRKDMFAIAAGIGVGAKVAGAIMETQESAIERDNRIRTAEINEMMLSFEEADLQRNYQDRLGIIAQRGAQQVGEMKAAAAAGGIDVDSVSAQANIAAQRRVTTDDMDAIRSQVVAAQRGIQLRKANLKIEKEAAKAQHKIGRDKATFGAALDLASGYVRLKKAGL